MHRAQRFPYREAGASALRGLLPLARSLAVETAIEQRLDVNRKEDARHLPPNDWRSGSSSVIGPHNRIS